VPRVAHHRKDAVWDQALDWLLSAERAPDDADLQARLACWLSRGGAERAAYARARRVWRLAGLVPRSQNFSAQP
jgi:ferric-dicitrate binding protein FerR (iron transport regulator)